MEYYINNKSLQSLVKVFLLLSVVSVFGISCSGNYKASAPVNSTEITIETPNPESNVNTQEITVLNSSICEDCDDLNYKITTAYGNNNSVPQELGLEIFGSESSITSTGYMGAIKIIATLNLVQDMPVYIHGCPAFPKGQYKFESKQASYWTSSRDFSDGRPLIGSVQGDKAELSIGTNALLVAPLNQAYFNTPNYPNIKFTSKVHANLSIVLNRCTYNFYIALPNGL